MRSDLPRARPAGFPRLLVAVLAATLWVLGSSGQRVAAHTDLESSSPTPGETVTTPVTDVTLTWSGPVAPIDGGFEVTDSQGGVRQPTTVTATDGSTLVLNFDPPLAGGTVELRWSVTGADGHVIDGTFGFTVDAPLPTTTTVPATTTSTRAATTTTVAATTTSPDTAVAATTAPDTTTPVSAETSTPPSLAGTGSSDGGSGGAGPIVVTLAVIAAAGAAVTYAVLRARRRRGSGEAAEPV